MIRLLLAAAVGLFVLSLPRTKQTPAAMRSCPPRFVGERAPSLPDFRSLLPHILSSRLARLRDWYQPTARGKKIRKDLGPAGLRALERPGGKHYV